MSSKTGNIFIEFSDGKKRESGIAISTADYYIIYSCNKYYMIDINILKELTINKKIAKVADGTRGYLIKNNIFYENSIII